MSRKCRNAYTRGKLVFCCIKIFVKRKSKVYILIIWRVTVPGDRDVELIYKFLRFIISTLNIVQIFYLRLGTSIWIFLLL